MNDLNWNYNSSKSVWTAHTQLGIWSIKVQIIPDYDHAEVMGRGQLLSEYRSGAKVLCAKHVHESGYVAFMPATSRNDIVKSYIESGLNHIEPALRLVEAGKRADAEIQEDIEIVINPESHNLSAYGDSDAVCIDGITLGHDSLWGIESKEFPTEDTYIMTAVNECIEEAVSVATKPGQTEIYRGLKLT